MDKLLFTAVFFSLSIITNTATEINSQSLSSKIIGERIILPKQFLHVVSLRKLNGDHYCGGSLISEEHVLTAAYCLLHQKPIKVPKYDGIFVVIGTDSILGNGARHSIKHLDIYQGYSRGPEGVFGDIGLITLDKKVNMSSSSVSILELPSHDVPIDSKAEIEGWGSIKIVTGIDKPQISVYLKKLNVVVENNTICREAFNRMIVHHHLCVMPVTVAQTISKADSGAPLVDNNVIIGVVSYASFYTPKNPIICTKVVSLLGYIQDAKRRGDQDINPHKPHPSALVRKFNNVYVNPTTSLDCPIL